MRERFERATVCGEHRQSPAAARPCEVGKPAATRPCAKFAQVHETIYHSRATHGLEGAWGHLRRTWVFAILDRATCVRGGAKHKKGAGSCGSRFCLRPPSALLRFQSRRRQLGRAPRLPSEGFRKPGRGRFAAARQARDAQARWFASFLGLRRKPTFDEQQPMSASNQASAVVLGDRGCVGGWPTLTKVTLEPGAKGRRLSPSCARRLGRSTDDLPAEVAEGRQLTIRWLTEA